MRAEDNPLKKQQQLHDGQQAKAEYPGRTARYAAKDSAIAGAPIGSRCGQKTIR